MTAPEHTPRLYQEELCEKAVQQNVIAYLGTGTGKTFIAMMVIKQKADAILAAKQLIVFTAPTVALVSQQSRALAAWLDLRVEMVVGEMGVDAWREAEWLQLRQRADVIVCTPMVMVNALSSTFIKMEHIGLLVVDECHRCRKGDASNRIMREFYHRSDPTKRPHIFGMTASPTVCGSRKSQVSVQAAFMELEANLDAQIITVLSSTKEVDEVAPRAQVMDVEYPPDSWRPAATRLHERLEAACGMLRMAAACMKQRQVLRDQQVLVAQLPEVATRGAMEDVVLEGVGGRGNVEQVAAWMQGVHQVAVEMGPWPAAAALAEVLGRPEEEGPDFAQWQAACAAEEQVAAELVDAPAGSMDAERAEQLVHRVQELQLELRKNQAHLAVLLKLFLGGHQEAADALPAGGQPLSGKPLDTRLPLETQAVQAAVRGSYDALAAVLVPSASQRAELCAAFEQAVSGRMQDVVEGVLRPCAEALLAAVSTAALTADVLHSDEPEAEEWLRVTGCPLVANKPRAAILYLLHDLEEYGPAEKRPGVSSTAAISPADQRWSCLIFVQRKLTAACLRRLMASLPEVAAKLPADIITGYGGRVASMTLKRQDEALARFRSGQVVALVATSVAEEGLDLQSCQLVLRYHLPTNVLSYVQSRGRARMKQSRMVLLMRSCDMQQAALVDAIKAGEDEMLRAAQQRTQQLDEVDAEEAEGDEGDPDALARLLAAGGAGTEYRVPATGAVVTLAGAKQMLHMYCQKLPSDKYTLLRPRFTRPRWTQGSAAPAAVCGVALPNAASVHWVEGAPQPSFRAARASAALAAVKELHLAGALSDYLQPLVKELEEALPDSEGSGDEGAGEDAAEAAGQRAPVSLLQAVPDVLKWDAGSRCTPPPAPTSSGGKYKLHVYGFSLQPLNLAASTTSSSGLDTGGGLAGGPAAAATSESMQMPAAACADAERENGAPEMEEAEPGQPTAAGLGGSSQDAGAGLPHTWAAQLWGAVEEWGLLLPRQLPELPAFRMYPPVPEGQPPQPLLARIVYRGTVEVGGAVLRSLQSAHSTAVRSVAKPRRKDLAAVQAAPDPADLPSDPIPPAAWTASSNGAWFILAPLRLPAHQPNLSASAGGAPLLVAAGQAGGQQAVRLDWRAVDRLLRGPVSLEAAFDFTAFADPTRREWAAQALLQLTAGGVLETRYNGCLYRVLGPPSECTTLQSLFPPPKEGEEAYISYLDYYQRRHLQQGLVPEQPLLLATRHVSLPGAAHMLAPTVRGRKRHAPGGAGGRAGASGTAGAGVPRTSASSDAATSCSAAATSTEDGGSGQQSTEAGTLPESGTSDAARSGAAGPPGAAVSAAAEDSTEAITQGSGAAVEARPQTTAEVLLPGQVCYLHPVGGWQWRALQVLPGLTYRMHSLLLMDELRSTLLAIPGLPRQLGLEELLGAFTTTAAQEDFDLERHELLGDAVLKLVACYTLFRQHPGDHEGMLTARKDAIVSNRHLAAAAERAGLHRYLRVWQYDHSAWLLHQPGLPSPPPVAAGNVRRKTLADLVEALLGLTFHTQGLPGTIALMRHLRLLPPHLLQHLELISAPDTHLALHHLFSTHRACPAAPQTGPAAMATEPAAAEFATAPAHGATGLPQRGCPMTADERSGTTPLPGPDPQSQRQKAERLARASRAVGWVFGNPELVQEAFTHCSWPYPNPPCYQRLEFLGDAVLDLLVTYQLYVIHPDLAPGQLHPRKAGIVNNHRLAALAARAELQKGLVHANATLQVDITRYLDKLAAPSTAEQPSQAATVADVANGLQQATVCGGLDAQQDVGQQGDQDRRMAQGGPGHGAAGGREVEAPKVMADLVEALLGAVFLDCGGDLLAAAQVCTRLHLLAPGTAVHALDPGGDACKPTSSSPS